MGHSTRRRAFTKFFPLCFDKLIAQIGTNPHTVSAVRPVRVAMLKAKKFLEHSFAELWWDARAGLCHGNMQEPLSVSSSTLP